MLKLDSQRSRVGFVVFCTGVLLMVVPYALSIEINYYGEIQFPSLKGFLRWDSRRSYAPAFKIGLGFAIAGAWLAWFYPQTLGRLIRWVRVGPQ